MYSIQVFKHAHHILENILLRFLSNVLNFHGNTSLQLFGGGWGSGKNLIFLMPPQEKIKWG